MSLLGYPDWAINKKGKKKPWVTGPSPISQALLTAGLGILADDSVDPWMGGGGIDLSGIAKGGLLGLQQYGQATKNLHSARKDYYDELSDRENQLIANQEAKLKFQTLDEKRAHFPNLIKQLRAMNDPNINTKINALAQLGRADINSAYNAATNILSAASKTRLGDIKTRDGIIYQEQLGPGGEKIGEEFKAQVSTSNPPKLSSFDRLNLALKPGGVPLGPGEFQRLRNNHLQKETKFPKRYTEENVEQLLRVSPSYIPDVFEYIEQYQPHLMTKPDGSIKTKEELKTEFNLSEPQKAIEEITSGIKKPSSDSVRDLLKISGIKFTDKFLEQQLAKGDYDPTKIKFDTWLAYIRESGLKMPGPAKSYEDTAQVGARLFGYLMSGATVKEEEMTAMRTAFYPIPGDTEADVKRKREYRNAMVNIFISQLDPRMKKIMANEVAKIEEIASNPILVTREIKKPKPESNTTPIIELDSLESKNIIDQYLP